MQNITTHTGYPEGLAADAIFDACRANPNREPKGRVTFTPTINGYEAALRDENGIVIALADVDEYDV